MSTRIAFAPFDCSPEGESPLITSAHEKVPASHPSTVIIGHQWRYPGGDQFRQTGL
jgi:hypothetical protein